MGEKEGRAERGGDNDTEKDREEETERANQRDGARVSVCVCEGERGGGEEGGREREMGGGREKEKETPPAYRNKQNQIHTYPLQGRQNEYTQEDT